MHPAYRLQTIAVNELHRNVEIEQAPERFALHRSWQNIAANDNLIDG